MCICVHVCLCVCMRAVVAVIMHGCALLPCRPIELILAGIPATIKPRTCASNRDQQMGAWSTLLKLPHLTHHTRMHTCSQVHPGQYMQSPNHVSRLPVLKYSMTVSSFASGQSSTQAMLGIRDEVARMSACRANACAWSSSLCVSHILCTAAPNCGV